MIIIVITKKSNSAYNFYQKKQVLKAYKNERKVILMVMFFSKTDIRLMKRFHHPKNRFKRKSKPD